MKKDLAAFLLLASMSGIGSDRPYANESIINDRSRYKGKGFSGGEKIMRPFIINGVEIMATDKKMAQKKYAAKKTK